MAYTKIVPLTDFTTSGGLVAQDQLAQSIAQQIPVALNACHQDFVNEYLVFQSQLSPTEESDLDGIIAAHTATGRLVVGPVATLPNGLFEGEEGYATDGRKVGEGVGAGTGVEIYWSNAAWRVFSDDTAVLA